MATAMAMDTRWCPRPIAKLVQIPLISLGLVVYIYVFIYIYKVNGTINQLVIGGHNFVEEDK